MQGINFQLYADDTVIHTAGCDMEEVTRNLQVSLDKFVNWCRANKLSLNSGKTKCMVFGTRQRVKKASKCVIKIGNTPLKIVPTYKYLGFTLDSTLSFNYQVRSVSSMVSYKINLLAKIRKYLTDDVALKIYKSMILPYFDYGDIVYDGASQGETDKLQRLQNKGLKICMGFNRRYDTDNLHVLTKMPKLKVRRNAHLNNFMYNRVKSNVGVDGRDIRTRAHDAPLFTITVPKLEAYKRSVQYAGASKWNELPANLRNIGSFSHFKANQRDTMLKST